MAKGYTVIGGVEYVAINGRRATCPICRRPIRAITPHTGNAQRGKSFRWLHGSHSTPKRHAMAVAGYQNAQSAYEGEKR